MENDLKAGDRVRLTFGFADQSGEGEYEIVRVLPDAVNGERQYRVRGADGHERAIGSAQIAPTEFRLPGEAASPS